MLLVQTTFAQNDSITAIAELKKLDDLYKSMRYLSFDVKYRYRDEKDPSVYLDSLKGSVKINGKRLSYSIANTEVIYDSLMAIVFYHEDSIIYLSKPQQNLLNSPLTTLDVGGMSGYHFVVNKNEKTTTIIMQPGDSETMKEIVYEINRTTGMLTRIQQVVNQKLLYESGTTEAEGFAIVDIEFDNYSKRPFDTSIFNTGNYVKMVDGKFQSAHPFESYTIFNGNINL